MMFPVSLWYTHCTSAFKTDPVQNDETLCEWSIVMKSDFAWSPHFLCKGVCGAQKLSHSVAVAPPMVTALPIRQ